MKIQVKKIAIRSAIWFLQGILLVGRALGALGRIFAPWVRGFFRVLGRGTILPAYHLGVKARRLLFRFFSPEHRSLAIRLVQTYLPHTALVLVLVVAATSNINVHAAAPEDAGQQSILFSLIQGEEGEGLGEVDTDSIDFDDFIEEESLATVEGGSAIVKPTLITGERTAIVYHVVAPGDTLSSIATRYNIDITSILWANKMGVRDYIRPGNRLTIPPVSGVIHTVKKGDTVLKIAKLYNADKEKLLAFNHLGEGQELTLGEILVVPGGRVAPPPAPVRRVLAPISRVILPGRVGGAITKLLWPTLAARITQYFSWRHSGVDLALPTGNPVYASDDGIVTFAGWSRGYGYRIDIDHGNGMVTRYAHNSKLLASVGESVARGQTVALVGSTGRSTGPHVHFEVILAGRRVNPLKYIR